jgi:hypothetical protein
MYYLISKSSRMSYYLLFVLALPVLFNTGYILDIWLEEVPVHSTLFVQLFLIFTLSESLSNPLITAQLATGNIRNYQLVVGGLQLLNIPVSYAFLKAGAAPEITVMVAIAISQICFFARLFMLKGMIGLPVGDFLKKVYMNVLGTTALSLAVPFVIHWFLPDTIWGGIISVTLCVISAGLSVLTFGLSRGERHEISCWIKKALGK